MVRALFLLLLLSVSPSLAQEVVHFPSRDRTTLQARLFRPAGDGVRQPAVVLMHGCGGLARGDGALFPRHLDWAERLRSAGFVVLLPDSFASRGAGSQCRLRDRRVPLAMRVQDARGALDFLVPRPDVDPARITLIGWSHGGSTVLRVAGLMPDVPGFRRVIAFYPGCQSLIDRNWRARLPTTILHGTDDDWTPVEPCEALARIGGPVTIETFAGAHHGFDAPNAPLRQQRGLAFSKRGDGIATSGTHEPSRQKAIERVMQILHDR